MDFLYFYKHGGDDFELRYSLRSIERHASWVRKVWIYGDRPDFLTEDKSVAEHVSDDFGASIFGFRPPVKNFFLMLFLTSLIPELSPEYIWCSDDHWLLKDYNAEQARKLRYYEDMTKIPSRGTGLNLWQTQLWHTHDTLTRLGYSAYNFETHTPIHFTKRRVMEAYRDLRDFATEDRWAGLTGATAILNHAHKRDGVPVHCIRKEGSRAGWGGDKGWSHGAVVRETVGKTFLFLSEGALTPVTRRFLMERFPSRSRFEGDHVVQSGVAA